MKKLIEKYPVIPISLISLFGLFVWQVNREFMIVLIFVMLVVINHNLVVKDFKNELEKQEYLNN